MLGVRFTQLLYLDNFIDFFYQSVFHISGVSGFDLLILSSYLDNDAGFVFEAFKYHLELSS